MLNILVEVKSPLPVGLVINTLCKNKPSILSYIEKLDKEVDFILAVERSDACGVLKFP
jgi:hypothetical protein